VLATRIAADTHDALARGDAFDAAYPICNRDRSIGARLSGVIARLHGDAGLPEGADMAFSRPERKVRRHAQPRDSCWR
jgi:glutamate synthase domain-containing protein 3